MAPEARQTHVGAGQSADEPNLDRLQRLSHSLRGDLQLSDPTPRVHASDAGHFVLFFDGFKMENPGRGAAGSVLVHLGGEHDQPAICRVTNMAYGSQCTTPLKANYRGLLVGLQRAAETSCTPLHVVGTSGTVLHRMEERSEPRKPELRRLHQQCCEVAKRVKIMSWLPITRAFNQMAWTATHFALDSERSRQHTCAHPRLELSPVGQHLSNDLAQWR